MRTEIARERISTNTVQQLKTPEPALETGTMTQLYLVRDYGLQSTLKLVRLPIFPELCYGYNYVQPRKESEFISHGYVLTI